MKKIILSCLVGFIFLGCNKPPASKPEPVKVKVLAKTDLDQAYSKIQKFASFTRSSQFSFKNIIVLKERGKIDSSEKEFRKWERKASVVLDEASWKNFSELLTFCEVDQILTVVNQIKEKMTSIKEVDNITTEVNDDIKGFYKLLQEFIGELNKKRNNFITEKANEVVEKEALKE